jgi:protein SCO1/2
MAKTAAASTRALLLLMLAAVAASAGCGSDSSSPAALAGAKQRLVSARASGSRFIGTSIPADTTTNDFALRDQNGRLIRLSDQRGRLVFVAFLYTHCEDVCPLIATWLDEAVRAQGARARDVRVLAVSVDPVGDTRSVVRRFMRKRRLGPEFHWLIGTRAQLAPVWQSYNILVDRRSPDRVVHSAPVFLLDRRGRARLFYPPPQNGREFAHDLRLLLAS